MQLRNTGACKMLVWLANMLCKQGMEVTVCTYIKCDDGLYKELDSNIKYIDASLSEQPMISKIISKSLGKNENYFDKYNFVSNFLRIRNIIKQNKFDICISFLLDSNVLNTLCCLGIKCKSIICERNNPFKKGYYKLKLFKPVFSLSDAAVFQLPDVSKYYNNIKKYAVIPNPVQSKREKVKRKFIERKDIIIVVGRLSIEQKRQDIAIKAFSMIHQEFPNVSLDLWGTGPDEKELRKIVSECGLNERVFFRGVTDGIIEEIGNSKMLLLTSDYEGIPNVVIEAMSIGIPVVSTDTEPGGSRLLIENGKNGILVQRGDVKAVSNAIKELLAYPEFADTIGDNAYTINEKYSPDVIISQWLDFINNIYNEYDT